MITLTDKPKNAVSLTNKGKSADNTFDDMDMSWDDADDTWDNQTTIMENKSRNTVLLTDRPKI